MFSISQPGIDIITKHTHFRKKAFYDRSKVPTIGYMHFYNPEDMQPIEIPSEINFTTSERWLKIEIDKDIAPKLQLLVKFEANQNQIDAMLSICHDIGIIAFQASKLLRMINANPTNPEIHAEWLMHAIKDGRYNDPLMLRRTREVTLFFKQ